jgi:hypothetical protein
MKKMVKLFLSFVVLSFGAGSVHAFKQTIQNQLSAGTLRVELYYDQDCVPLGGNPTHIGIMSGQSATVDSGSCRLNEIRTAVTGRHNFIPSRQHFAGGAGNGEWVVNQYGIKKIK